MVDSSRSINANGATKGNNGRGRNRREFPKRFGLTVIFLSFVYYLIPSSIPADVADESNFMLQEEQLGLVNLSVDEKRDNVENINENISIQRDQNSSNFKKSSGRSSIVKVLPDSEEEMLILSGRTTLVDVLPSTADMASLSRSDSSYNARAIFCEVNWSLHKEDPPSYAMFRILMSESYRCQQEKYEVDLYYIAQKAREIERSGNNTLVKSLKPNGFVFHESRCGSTLVANSLASFDPLKTRVFSESPPPINAFRACDSFPRICNEEKHVKLIQDVIYMMGWTGDITEEYLFFKIQSIGTKNIKSFRKAFPKVPWIFVYRDPVQVMMSHLKGYPQNKHAFARANCLRTLRSRPKDTMDLAKRILGKSNPSLSKLEFCAAHLATLCETAYNEHEESGTGMMVEYSTLPDILIDKIIPKYFLNEIGIFGSTEAENIRAVNKLYSKGHTQKTRDQVWKSDNEVKENSADQRLREVAKAFLQPVFDKMKKDGL